MGWQPTWIQVRLITTLVFPPMKMQLCLVCLSSPVRVRGWLSTSAKLGYKQELRRNFSKLEIFAIAFSIMGLLPSIASTLTYSIPAGPAGMVWVSPDEHESAGMPEYNRLISLGLVPGNGTDIRCCSRYGKPGLEMQLSWNSKVIYRLILALHYPLLEVFTGGRIFSHLRLPVILSVSWSDIAIA